MKTYNKANMEVYEMYLEVIRLGITKALKRLIECIKVICCNICSICRNMKEIGFY